MGFTLKNMANFIPIAAFSIIPISAVFAGLFGAEPTFKADLRNEAMRLSFIPKGKNMTIMHLIH